MMCLLSRECTNCVSLLKKQKPKLVSPPAFILSVNPKSPGPCGGGSAMGRQLILGLSLNQRASSESSVFCAHGRAGSRVSLLRDPACPRDTVRAR